MEINLIKINKEILIECLKEENDRDDFTRHSLEFQVKNHQTYGKQEEFEQALDKYNRKKDYFNSMINAIPYVDSIEEIDQEYIQFWNDLIDHQIYISNSRINDWSEGGDMYKPELCEDVDNFEIVCQKIINADLNKIRCMAKLSLMINK